MGILIGRVGMWRQWLGLTAALVAAFVTFIAAGKSVKVREEEPRVRQIDFDTALTYAGIQGDLARVASLWLDGRGLECRVATLYPRTDSAAFETTMSLALANPSDLIPRQITYVPGIDAAVTIERRASYEIEDAPLAA